MSKFDRIGVGLPLSHTMALKLLSMEAEGTEDNRRAIQDYMDTLNEDAEPGELVHITKAQLKELADFSAKFRGVPVMGRVYEEITHQQHQAHRWALLTRLRRREVTLWKSMFFVVVIANLIGQILRWIAA